MGLVAGNYSVEQSRLRKGWAVSVASVEAGGKWNTYESRHECEVLPMNVAKLSNIRTKRERAYQHM